MFLHHMHHGKSQYKMTEIQNLQRSESWLKKAFTVEKAAMWLQEKGSKERVSRRPLLRIPSVEMAALLPIYAIIEGTQEALGKTALLGTVDIALQQIVGSISPSQIKQLQRLSALASSFSKGDITCAHCYEIYSFLKYQIFQQRSRPLHKV